jgi:hypothetical protein
LRPTFYEAKCVPLRILLRGNFDRYPLNTYIIPDKMCVNISAKKKFNVSFECMFCPQATTGSFRTSKL